MQAAQQGREAEAASRKQEEVDMTARVAAETLRRMEVQFCAPLRHYYNIITMSQQLELPAVQRTPSLDVGHQHTIHVEAAYPG